MKLKIKVTREMLKKSAFCNNERGEAPTNCAIAMAVRDIFPNARVSIMNIHFDSIDGVSIGDYITLPPEVIRFINQFDTAIPSVRSKLPEIEFEILVPNSVIEKINIDEIKPLLENHPTLELIPG